MLKNREQLLEIINNDCDISGEYYNPETGETCAIGGLLKETGFDMSYFTQPWKAKGSNYKQKKNTVGIKQLPKALKHLHQVFGLNRNQAETIQIQNDRRMFGVSKKVKVLYRRQRVREVIDEMK